VEELEHGDTPPYEVLRKLFKTFGMDEMARQRFRHQIAKDKQAEEARARGEQPPAAADKKDKARSDGGDSAAMQIIPII